MEDHQQPIIKQHKSRKDQEIQKKDPKKAPRRPREAPEQAAGRPQDGPRQTPRLRPPGRLPGRPQDGPSRPTRGSVLACVGPLPHADCRCWCTCVHSNVAMKTTAGVRSHVFIATLLMLVHMCSWQRCYETCEPTLAALL